MISSQKHYNSRNQVHGDNEKQLIVVFAQTMVIAVAEVAA
jgi:hypothetical protein